MHKTLVLPFGDEAIAKAARLIAAGQPVAIATETVYGLAVDATNAAAVARVYAAKARPDFNPLIVHVSDMAAAERIGVFDDQARRLALSHWPGPLTLVVPRRTDSGIASLVTAGLGSVALRVPAHRAIRALLSIAGVPLAAPSANASGRLSPTSAAHVMLTLDGRIPFVIDDGHCSLGLESTVLAATGAGLRLLRPGVLMIEGADAVTNGKVEAPGQLCSHYAPCKPMRLTADTPRPGEYLIGFGAVRGDVSLSATGDLAEAASRLFDCLHLADASGATTIAVATLPTDGIGRALNDRLRRAAA